MGFVFFPESIIVNGEIRFYPIGTTSSGCIPDRPGAIEIKNPEQVKAIESRGAFWTEPNGNKIRLKIFRTGRETVENHFHGRRNINNPPPHFYRKR